jgi:hypothetical protein
MPDQTLPLALAGSNMAFSKNLFDMGLAAAPIQNQIALDQFKGGIQLANLVGSQGQEAANRMLGYATSQPLETWTPDIFGNQGALTQAAQVAAINQFKSRELEKQVNAPAAQAREQITQAAADMVSPDFWQKQMDQWGKTKGLQAYLGTGLQDSTIGKSGFYDLATPQGQAFRAQNLATAQSIIGAQPTTGIDPATAVGQLQAAQSKAMQDRAAYRAGILAATERAGQTAMTAQANAANAYQQGSGMYAKSTSDWINQLMGGYSQMGQSQLGSMGNLYNKTSQDWQNYQQGVMNASAQNAASQNAAMGSYIGAGGAALGATAIII